MLRERVTYANVVATLALFIALGGGAYAASKVPKNSVGSRQIKKNSITSAKVKNHSLLALDFKSGQLPAGRQGPQGPKGDTGPAGVPDTLPSGKTLYGTYSVLGHATGSSNDRSSSPISFPFPLAAAPARAVLVPSGGANPDPTHCPGSATAPAATAGTLCVYEGQQTNTTGNKICLITASGLCAPGVGGAADRFGATVNVFAAADGTYISTGTWAVTAP